MEEPGSVTPGVHGRACELSAEIMATALEDDDMDVEESHCHCGSGRAPPDSSGPWTAIAWGQL